MLDILTLRVRDPAAQRQFYRTHFGMIDLDDGCIGFGAPQMAIRFIDAEGAYAPQANDVYWKIALSVPDLDLAYRQLLTKGAAVTEPIQFRDVGYLCKVTDPEGFSVELIEHWFKGERPNETSDTARLGGGAHLSLLTLRTPDISTIEPDILDWGMAPLSVQPVEPFGFTLYFYAFTEDSPPNADLTAIENRTWTYQRPYTVLEIQHVHKAVAETYAAQGAAGYGGATLTTVSDVQSNPLMLSKSGT